MKSFHIWMEGYAATGEWVDQEGKPIDTPKT